MGWPFPAQEVEPAEYPWLSEEPELVMVQGLAAVLLLDAEMAVGGHRAQPAGAAHMRRAATMAPVWLAQVAGFFAQWVEDQQGRGTQAPQYQAGAVEALRLVRADGLVRQQVQTLVHLGTPGKAANWLLRRARGGT